MTARRIAVVVASITVFAVAAGQAAAADRYVSPAGTGSKPCVSPAAPCSTVTADGAIVTGDIVHLAPGTYTQTELGYLPGGIAVVGDPALPRPAIVGDVGGTDETVDHVELDATGTTGNVYSNSILSDVVVDESGSAILDLWGNSTLWNSVVLSHDGTDPAVRTEENATSPTTVLNLYQDTIVNTAVGGTAVAAVNTGAALDIEAFSTIVVGKTTLACLAGSGHSNLGGTYDSLGVVNLAPGGSCSASNNATNSVAAPVFEGPVGASTVIDDLHEAPTSPTIDADLSPPAQQPFDIDGQTRVQGTREDVGADESPVLAATEPAGPAGTNLLANPGAEVGGTSPTTVAAPPSWATSGALSQVAYGSAGFPSLVEAARDGAGTAFFAGGPATAASSASQSVDISADAIPIDYGAASITLSALLGGFADQQDQASVTATFKNAAGSPLGAVTIGPVTRSDRGGLTALLRRTASAVVPSTTRTITVEIDAANPGNPTAYDDGYADDVGLFLNSPLPPAPTVITNTVTVLVPQPPAQPAAAQCVVPKLINLPKISLSSKLKAAKCVLGTVTTPKSLRKVHGLVVRSQRPAAGTKVKAGTKVSVTLGRKPKPKAKHKH
jgi:PASTA domain